MKHTKQDYLDAFRKIFYDIKMNCLVDEEGNIQSFSDVEDFLSQMYDNCFDEAFKQGFNSCKEMVEKGEHIHCCVIPNSKKELTQGETEECLCHCHDHNEHTVCGGCMTDIRRCPHCYKEQSTGVR